MKIVLFLITSESYNKTCNILTEYGVKLSSNYSSEAYYEEYFEVIIKNNALEKLFARIEDIYCCIVPHHTVKQSQCV